MAAAQYFSEGQQTDPSANTVLVITDPLVSSGIIGANYEVSILLNGSVAMDYKLETLDQDDMIVNTIWLSVPANQVTLINPRATFFVPNDYTLQVRNNTIVTSTNTLQASIILLLSELVDE